MAVGGFTGSNLAFIVFCLHGQIELLAACCANINNYLFEVIRFGRNKEWIAMGGQVEVPVAGDEESDAASVEEQLQALRKEKGTLRVVTGRGLGRDDVAVIDFSSALAESGEAIEGSRRQGMQLDMASGEQTLGLPGAASSLKKHACEHWWWGIYWCTVHTQQVHH